MANNISLTLIGPKRVATSESTKVHNEVNRFIKMVAAYERLESLRDIPVFTISPLGANSYIEDRVKSLGLKTTQLHVSAHSTDDAFEDLLSRNYSKNYILILWDGVDDNIIKSIKSSNKFGFQPKIRIIRRWSGQEKTFV